jgi:hypothetical protein
MKENDDQSVLTLYKQGKFICYFSEMDPFTGKWLELSPEKAADRAIYAIKILCLAFHHVIIPPGYLIKNPVMWIVLRRLKPLFEYGLLSISIDRKFSSNPSLFFEQKLEEEVYHDVTGIGLSHENRHGLNKQMKTLVENGYFLFRDSTVQITGFGNEAETLSTSLARQSENRPEALIEGIKRLKDEGLISSRDHWMALLHHPSYHPPPDAVEEITQLIHKHYFQQGWIGNHCVMYPSAFLTASYSPVRSSFPFKWFAFHVSVIAEVIAHQGVDPGAVFNLPLDDFIHDLVCTPELDFWRQAYHAHAEQLEASIARHFKTQEAPHGPGTDPLSFANTDLGKRITHCLIVSLGNMGMFMQRSVSRLRIEAESPALVVPGHKSGHGLPPMLPGAGFLDLKIRMACGWEPRKRAKQGQYIISFLDREIKGPDGRKAKFDRAPFQLFLALLQKHGRLLERSVGTAIVERITRESHGPIMLQHWDPPPGIRSEAPISYPEMNRIVAKLKNQLKKIGLEHAFKTVRAKGWRLLTSGSDFVFRDMPICLPDSMGLTFLTVDINTREVRHLGKKCRLGPLPFKLFQLLMRYSGVPINTRLINLELGLIREPLSAREYNSVQDRIRQYFKILRKAFSDIGASVSIVSEYGVGWRLSPLK